MEPDFEVPELSLSPGPSGERIVRVRPDRAAREGLDPRRRYPLLDIPPAGIQTHGEDEVWVDDDGRPRRIPLAWVERRRERRSGRP